MSACSQVKVCNFQIGSNIGKPNGVGSGISFYISPEPVSFFLFFNRYFDIRNRISLLVIDNASGRSSIRILRNCYCLSIHCKGVQNPLGIIDAYLRINRHCNRLAINISFPCISIWIYNFFIYLYLCPMIVSVIQIISALIM